MLETAKLAPGEPVQLGGVAWQGTLHGPFDTGIAWLLRIQFGRIGRQVGHREVAPVRSQKSRGPVGPVGVEPVPDHQERPAEFAPEVPQGLDDGRA